MNKIALIIILILSGGMFNSNIDNNEDVNSNSSLLNISSLYSGRYSMETYVTACNNMMHENGLFYSNKEVNECKKSVTENYEWKLNEFDRPDFDFYTMKNTNQKATYTNDIYKIDVFGIYCDSNGITDLLMDGNCETKDIGSIYISKSSLSNEWGYAAKGFETTDGEYLKVVRP